ncbi:MAG: carboxypeptidase regulatory-like domain-containing protein [Planctomycetes bacterium]|nr:carboxypeptidase regulatory-like domain-containing protein [Planctomycetota bacterium]
MAPSDGAGRTVDEIGLAPPAAAEPAIPGDRDSEPPPQDPAATALRIASAPPFHRTLVVKVFSQPAVPSDREPVSGAEVRFVVTADAGGESLITARTDARGCVVLDLSDHGRRRNGELRVEAPRCFPFSSPVTAEEDERVVLLEPRCRIVGEIDWERSATVQLGGAWSLFAIVGADGGAVRESRWLRDDAATLDELRRWNEARFEVPPHEYRSTSHVVGEHDGVRLHCVPIEGRGFTLEDLRLGETCCLRLALVNSEPRLRTVVVDRHEVDVGGLFVPGMSKLALLLVAPDGSPAYPDPAWRAWCTRTSANNGGVAEFTTFSELRFDEQEQMTYALFWGAWREEYLLGLSGAPQASTFVVRVPESADAQRVTCVVAPVDGGGSRRLRVVGADRDAIAGARVELLVPGSEAAWRAVASEDGEVVLADPRTPDATIRVSAGGFRSRLVDLEQLGQLGGEVVLEPLQVRRIRLAGIDAQELRSRTIRLLSLAEGGATSESRVESIDGSIELFEAPGETLAALVVEGHRAIVVRRAGTVIDRAVVDLERCVGVEMRLVGERAQGASLRSLGLMRSVLVRESSRGEPSLTIETRYALDRDGVARLQLQSADAPIEVRWPRYRGGEERFLDVMPIERGGVSTVELSLQ